MRLQHLEQIAGGLSADDPAQVAAKVVIVEEVDRLHWRLWNGKANATLALWKRVEESACGSAGNDKGSQAERTAWR